MASTEEVGTLMTEDRAEVVLAENPFLTGGVDRRFNTDDLEVGTQSSQEWELRLWMETHMLWSPPPSLTKGIRGATRELAGICQF